MEQKPKRVRRVKTYTLRVSVTADNASEVGAIDKLLAGLARRDSSNSGYDLVDGFREASYDYSYHKAAENALQRMEEAFGDRLMGSIEQTADLATKE